MNTKEQKIARAEACGFTVISDTVCRIYPNPKTGEPEIEPITELSNFEPEEPHCPQCSGTGEGCADGVACSTCKGRGY